MRRRRIPSTIVLGLAMVLLPSALLPAGAAADEPPPPTLVDVRLSRATVDVSGLGTVAVTVSVHLRDPSGVVETVNPEIPAPWPLVALQRISGGPTGGAPIFDYRDLDLTSGTATDGTWTATMRVPSTYDGTWAVTGVWAQNNAGSLLYADPRRQGMVRTLAVHGAHQPSLSFGFSPTVLVGAQRTVSIKGRVLDADSGAPVRGLLLTLGDGGRENCGAFGYGGSAWTVTDARGYYAFRGLPANAGYFCVLSTLPQQRTVLDQYRMTTLLRREGSQPIQPVLSAVPARTPVRVGDTVAVHGTAAPARFMTGWQVVLQRLVAGTWRPVGTSRVRDSGRFTVRATPPTAGNHRYRVVLVGRFGVRNAVSPVFLVGAR